MSILRIVLILSLSILGLMAGGCASEKAKSVEREADMVGSMADEDAIAKKGFHEFFYSDKLSEVERRKLLQLHGKIFAKTRALRNQIGKYKAVLFQELVEPKQDEEKVEIIKNKIQELYLQRLDIMMASLDEANDILGRDPLKVKNLMVPFINTDVIRP